nr:PaaI family thioesterase [Micromonospora sp. DSM 115978]
MTIKVLDGYLLGRCTLGLGYEGPPGYVHGGVSAMLLDQILGDTSACFGAPGMTVSLSSRYRRPVPLDTPLLVRGEVTSVVDRIRDGVEAGKAGKKVTVEGTIATEAEPDVPLVEGIGVFVMPADKVRAEMFSGAP